MSYVKVLKIGLPKKVLKLGSRITIFTIETIDTSLMDLNELSYYFS